MTTYNPRGLSSNSIKLIAMMSMLIDHFGAIILDQLIGNAASYWGVTILSIIYLLCRAIGRIAFPLFCYQLVIGFYKTSNRTRYILSLSLLSLASEVPFDLAAYDRLIYPENQNAVFTLLIGMVAMSILDTIRKRDYPAIFQILTIIISCVFAWGIKADYQFAGVLLILGFYYIGLDRSKIILPYILFYIAEIVLNLMGIIDIFTLVMESLCICSIVVIQKDNFIRNKNKVLKYMGYLFYPLQFLILYSASIFLK